MLRKLLRDALPGLRQRDARASPEASPQASNKPQVLPTVAYNEDGLATVHAAGFVTDARFARAYELGRATGSWRGAELRWRVHVLCWAAQHALSREGDFVECGVNRGGYARAIIDYTNFAALPRRFYLLDTFAGRVDEYISDEERQLGLGPGGYAECYDDVRETFSPFQNVVIVRGPVPDTLPQVASESVAFLSIDMNCVPPEIAAASYFWDKLSKGAVVVLDDYGAPGHTLQKRAFDQFSAERNVPIMQLPTGQGILIKP